jgi:alkylhydroperoxidase family enzyme
MSYIPDRKIMELSRQINEAREKFEKVAAERDALRDDLAAARARNQECDLLLSRVLHELAGAASLCWVPKPTGVFDSQLAIGFVEAAIQELRSALAGKDAPKS